MVHEPPAPRWPRYGLRGDPFFSNPLDPEEPDLSNRPITLFRGRITERRRLAQSVLDGNHTVTLIHAAGGHGKTTLANAVAYDLGKQGYLIATEEVEYTSERGTLGFFHGVLHGTLQALNDVDAIPATLGEGGKADARLPALAEARRLVDFIKARSGWSVGGGALGLSGQVGVQHEFLRPAFEPVASVRLLDRIGQEIKSLDSSFEGIVVRVNNLEVAALQDKGGLLAFFHAIRDLLQVDGFHFIFMGSDAVQGLLASETRIQSVFEAPLQLREFSVQDVQEILKARYDHLIIPGKRLVEPVATDLVHSLHEAHYGDLRNILRDLRRAIQAVDPVEARPIKASEAVTLLEEFHFEQLSRHLTPEHWQTLDVLEGEKPLRQKDVADVLCLTEATISQRFRKLTDLNAVELVAVEGRSQYWRLAGQVRIGLQAARRNGAVKKVRVDFTDMAREEKLQLIDRCLDAVDVTQGDGRSRDERCQHAHNLLSNLRIMVYDDERVSGDFKAELQEAIRDLKNFRSNDELVNRMPYLLELGQSL